MSFATHAYFSSRHYLFIALGILLCSYFLYHSFQGNRSYLKLVSLDSQITSVSSELDQVKGERIALERKVTMLRPGTINADFLEERARLILGYKAPEELIIIEH